MANNWQPPSASTAGWVPGGLGFGAFMGGLRKGVSRWRERKDEYAAQQLAVQQYEEEKEAKRKQQMYERAQAQINALAEQRERWEDWLKTEAATTRREDFLKEMEYIRQAGKEKETKQEKWQTELDKHLTRFDKLQTDFAQRRADEIRRAINAGDVGKLEEIHKQVLQNADLMRQYTRKVTTKEGKQQEVTEESNDINELSGALYFITRLMKQKYGEPAVQTQAPAATRDSVEYRADRSRIIQLLKAGRDNDALQIMRKYDLTEDEVNEIEKAAGR